jgi:hypothetical protein
MFRLEDAAGTRLRVRSGSVWITQERDHRDHYVPATGSIALDRPGLALVHALQPAELVVWRPVPQVSRAARVARALAGWIARRFGPEGIENQRMRGSHGAL